VGVSQCGHSHVGYVQFHGQFGDAPLRGLGGGVIPACRAMRSFGIGPMTTEASDKNVFAGRRCSVWKQHKWLRLEVQRLTDPVSPALEAPNAGTEIDSVVAYRLLLSRLPGKSVQTTRLRPATRLSKKSPTPNNTMEGPGSRLNSSAIHIPPTETAPPNSADMTM